MFTVRIHGFGGQGVLAVAELLAVAAFTDGRYGEAFADPGRERTGVPALAYCRIDDRPLPGHEPAVVPDAVIVRDAGLLHVVDVFSGLGPEGFVLIDADREPDGFGLPALARFHPERTATVPASEIARRELGHPLPNSALLGGLAALTGVVSLGAVETALRQRFSGRMARDNVEAARDAFAFAAYQARARFTAQPGSSAGSSAGGLGAR